MRAGLVGTLGAIAFALVVGGCASSGSPVAQIERAQEAVASARDLGAAFAPGAQDYLHSASAELSEAQRLAVRGHNDRATSMAMRAQADADLAARLAHEASLRGAAVRATGSTTASASVGGGPRDTVQPAAAGASAREQE